MSKNRRVITFLPENSSSTKYISIILHFYEFVNRKSVPNPQHTIVLPKNAPISYLPSVQSPTFLAQGFLTAKRRYFNKFI